MKKFVPSWSYMLACTLATAGVWSSAPAIAGDEPAAKPETFERRVFVSAEPNSQPRVMVWRGEDGSTIEFGRGYLGVQLVELTPELRKHFGVDEKSGVLVGQVEKDSPADKAGVQVGDIVISVDGENVAWSGEVGAQVRKKKQGELARLEVVRGGRGQTLQVEVAERDPERRLMRKIDLGGHPGMEIERLGPAMERAFEVIDDPAIRARLRDRVELRTARTEELEKRLKQLEGRLKELEKLLDEKNRR
jgi:hypothetical protein